MIKKKNFSLQIVIIREIFTFRFSFVNLVVISTLLQNIAVLQNFEFFTQFRGMILIILTVAKFFNSKFPFFLGFIIFLSQF